MSRDKEPNMIEDAERVAEVLAEADRVSELLNRIGDEKPNDVVVMMGLYRLVRTRLKHLLGAVADDDATFNLALQITYARSNVVLSDEHSMHAAVVALRDSAVAFVNDAEWIDPELRRALAPHRRHLDRQIAEMEKRAEMKRRAEMETRDEAQDRVVVRSQGGSVT